MSLFFKEIITYEMEIIEQNNYRLHDKTSKSDWTLDIASHTFYLELF